MSERVIIDRRYNGTPDWGHGGYVCGVVAGLIGGSSEVTLWRPAPLQQPLEVTRLDGGGVELRQGETVVAHGIPMTVEPDAPNPVGFEEAQVAAKSYPGFERHDHPTCFGCGPLRAEGDGLRIFPGVVAGRNLLAAPWTPDRSLLGEDGEVRPEFLWAALDCPMGWALASPPVLLGRLVARVLAPVKGNERCVLISWLIGSEGRKLHGGAALFGERQELRAVANSVWIRPR